MPEIDPVDEIALLGLAERARHAHDNNHPLEVTLREADLLRRYADGAGAHMMWERAIDGAFRDALPHVVPDPFCTAAAFGMLPVVIRQGEAS